jgi:lipopolysaccharide export system permease protein
MRLPRYLFSLVGGRILAALLVLVGILQILDLLDVTTDILDRKLGAGGVFYYAALRLPRLIEQAAPLAVLTGGLFAFAKLAMESAVTAMRSTGVSAYRLTAMALPAAVLVAVLQLTIGSVIAPRTDRILTDWWQTSAPREDAKPATAMTFRLGEDIVVATPSIDGRVLSDMSLYRRDLKGRLIQRTHADTATYADGRWTLTNPRFETLGRDNVQAGAAATMNWTAPLKPSDIVSLAANQGAVSPAEARRALDGGVSVKPRTYYDTQVQRAWAAPIACIVMLLLAAPAGMANFRGGGATLIVQCLAAGLLFLVFDGAFTALGESGAAPSILAAWAAPLIFAGLGVTALLYLEG